jgi:nucleoside-diphosphate-sugar epimerase
VLLELRRHNKCISTTRGGIGQVFKLAADMGRIACVKASHADISRNNIVISDQMLETSRLNGVSRFLFSSSACRMRGTSKATLKSHHFAKKARILPIPRRIWIGEALY